MATLAGFAESFAPGTLEYKRVSFDVSKTNITNQIDLEPFFLQVLNKYLVSK